MLDIFNNKHQYTSWKNERVPPKQVLKIIILIIIIIWPYIPSGAGERHTHSDRRVDNFWMFLFVLPDGTYRTLIRFSSSKKRLSFSCRM